MCTVFAKVLMLALVASYSRNVNTASPSREAASNRFTVGDSRSTVCVG